MVHFSPLQIILVSVIALLAVSLPTWVLWLAGKKVPPALTCAGRRSGFSGSLVLFTATLVFFFLYWVIYTAVDAAQAYRIFQFSSDYAWWQILSPMVPDILFILCFGYVIVRLTLARKAKVVGEAIAAVWVLGPVASLASFFLYFTNDLNVPGLFSSVIYAVAASFYLALSDRVQLTYGTKRGRKLPPLAIPKKQAN